MATARKASEIEGGILRPNAAIGLEFASTVLTLVRKLGDDIKRTMRELMEEHATDAAMDADPASQARIRLTALLNKWEPVFNRAAKKAAKRMVQRTVKNSQVTLGMSIREMSEGLKLDTGLMTEQLGSVIKASTTEAANLIKLIPQQYLGKVQNQVMRSITTGNGLQDLVPFLDKQYGGNIKHARLVAMDQTRKSYTSVNNERMKALGIKKVKFLHVGGSQEPRKLHLELSGKVFSLDDPPYIGDMYGQKVYGFGGVLPGCRCVCRPILDFGED